jgi:hypothetical protein
MIGHMMVARVIPEFALDESEAQQLGEAIANYLRHTKVKVDPKTRDLGALVLCCAMIYGPRLIAASNRAAANRAAKKRTGDENVVPLNPDIPMWQMPTSR